MANQYSTLNSSSATFDGIMKTKFGVVTVMNARVYDFREDLYTNAPDIKTLATKANFADSPMTDYQNPQSNYLCKLDTLKIANITAEGPSKTITGGQNADVLLKYGKTSRLEMQDALGDSMALAVLGGYDVSWDTAADFYKSGTNVQLHSTTRFGGFKTIVGDTFLIDKNTGTEVPAVIIFHKVLPDGISNLSQEAEGDAAVFDLNCDLIPVKLKVDNTNTGRVFYSIIEKLS